MSESEWAEYILEVAHRAGGAVEARQAVAAQVREIRREAIAEEREACALLAEGNYDREKIDGQLYAVASPTIAAAIRARK